MTATSVRSSAPTTLAWNSRRSVSRTVTSCRSHHVGVGEDVAVGADDEARARALHRRRRAAAATLVRAGHAEALEEIVERVVGRQSRDAAAAAAASRPPRRSPPPARSGRPVPRNPAGRAPAARPRLPGLPPRPPCAPRPGRPRARRPMRRQVARAGGERQPQAGERQQPLQRRGEIRVGHRFHGNTSISHGGLRSLRHPYHSAPTARTPAPAPRGSRPASFQHKRRAAARRTGQSLRPWPRA